MTSPPDGLVEAVQRETPPDAIADAGYRGWSPPTGRPTTLVILRHGVTSHTAAKRFSGGLGGSDPGLSDEGRDQVRAAADWLSGLAGQASAVITSPVRRTRESAEIVAAALDLPLEVEPGFAEMEFGSWDGLTFGEVGAQDRAALDAWLGSLDVAPPGGESFRVVEERVLAGLERLLRAHAEETVVVVSHVTPIKTLVSRAVGADLGAVFRMELSPASVTVLSFFPPEVEGQQPRGSMRLYNAQPPGRDVFADRGRW